MGLDTKMPWGVDSLDDCTDALMEFGDGDIIARKIGLLLTLLDKGGVSELLLICPIIRLEVTLGREGRGNRVADKGTMTAGVGPNCAMFISG